MCALGPSGALEFYIYHLAWTGWGFGFWCRVWGLGFSDCAFRGSKCFLKHELRLGDYVGSCENSSTSGTVTASGDLYRFKRKAGSPGKNYPEIHVAKAHKEELSSCKKFRESRGFQQATWD